MLLFGIVPALRRASRHSQWLLSIEAPLIGLVAEVGISTMDTPKANDLDAGSKVTDTTL